MKALCREQGWFDSALTFAIANVKAALTMTGGGIPGTGVVGFPVWEWISKT